MATASAAARIKPRGPRGSGEVPTGWVEFLRAHATITRQLDAALREGHGLSLNEYEVLLQLWLTEEGGLRRVDLAERLLITQGGVTRLLAGLARQGLVERAQCANDARARSPPAPPSRHPPTPSPCPRSPASSPTTLPGPSSRRAGSCSHPCPGIAPRRSAE